MLGGEGGLREPKGVAPTLNDAQDPGADELAVSGLDAREGAPAWVQGLFNSLELMHKKQDAA